ncbi:MAG: hypothetical protein A2Z20_01170 [Bdellovibrionales bacterium RBG_16_40_8]|nr:MAG: hypothetical protein A2Z20_01170 [Bdellovibrionales bacterium RBG_16_40_8]
MRFSFLSVLTFLSISLHAETLDKILAVINDDILTQSDVVDFQKKLKTNGLIDEALLSLYDRNLLIANSKQLIDLLIDEKIIDSEIRRQGLVSPIEQVESEIRNIANSRGMDRNQLKLVLKNEGIAYSDYQDFVKTSLQRQSLIQRDVTSKIKISDDEVNSFYVANHGSSKSLVFEYTLAHILFLSSISGPKEALRKAESIHKKLEQKIPFETLASQYSEDPNFVQGGLFGTFKISDFNKDVERVISKLNVSDISPVVKMVDGYRIFKVLKKTLVPSPELEAKREEIRRKLMSENFKRQFRLWLDQKRRDSYVRIN